MARVFLFFNHTLTKGQHEALHRELAISEVISPPEDLGLLWANIPPSMPTLRRILDPLFSWLESQALPDDYILIQGDFGACYLLVRHAFAIGLVPIYSTTKRQAREEFGEDETVRIEHQFQHVIFRRYGQ